MGGGGGNFLGAARDYALSANIIDAAAIRATLLYGLLAVGWSF
jgi:hypothetical protein